MGFFFSRHSRMAEYIKEATANLVENNLPVYYKYRYTFPSTDWEDLRDRKNRFENIFNYIKEHYSTGTQIVGGMEEYTKGMVATKPHIHIHFISKHKSDTIRKGLMREFNMIGRCQCCKPEVIVDTAKFWRYPLKQQKEQTKKHFKVIGFDALTVGVMIDVAYSCWKQAAEIAVNKVEKKLERTSKERLFAYLDDLLIDFKSIKQVCCMAYCYFQEHEESVCVRTIDAYVNLYILKKGYLSYEEFYDLSH